MLNILISLIHDFPGMLQSGNEVYPYWEHSSINNHSYTINIQNNICTNTLCISAYLTFPFSHYNILHTTILLTFIRFNFLTPVLTSTYFSYLGFVHCLYF